jgi:hypothetical protein
MSSISAYVSRRRVSMCVCVCVTVDTHTHTHTHTHATECGDTAPGQEVAEGDGGREGGGAVGAGGVDADLCEIDWSYCFDARPLFSKVLHIVTFT